MSENTSRFKTNERIVIEVAAMEFNISGNTIWIQSATGATTMRIKCTGKIIHDQCKNSPVSHCDIIVPGDIHICLSEDAQN